MEENLKDAVRPQSTNQRILRDIRAIQADIKQVEVHYIELENMIIMIIIDEENKLHK